MISALAIVLGACEEPPELSAEEQARMHSDEQIKIVASSQNMSEAEVREFYLQCVKEGGKGIIGGFGQPSCEKTTADAGKSCSKESDCEGFCLAETKSCAPQNPLFGCYDVLTEAGTKATICVD